MHNTQEYSRVTSTRSACGSPGALRPPGVSKQVGVCGTSGFRGSRGSNYQRCRGSILGYGSSTEGAGVEATSSRQRRRTSHESHCIVIVGAAGCA